jgi:hypothetical protein
MLELESMMRSPAFRKVPAQLCATRLIASVAPADEDDSSGTRALMKRAVRRRAASNASVMSAERW